MKKTQTHFLKILLILFLGVYPINAQEIAAPELTAQEITVHNLPEIYDFSSLKPHVWDKEGDNKSYIPVVFARIGNDFIYLNDKQILEFDKEMVDYYSLDKNEELFAAIHYKGPYRVVIYNIKESKRDEFLKLYL